MIELLGTATLLTLAIKSLIEIVGGWQPPTPERGIIWLYQNSERSARILKNIFKNNSIRLALQIIVSVLLCSVIILGVYGAVKMIFGWWEEWKNASAKPTHQARWKTVIIKRCTEASLFARRKTLLPPSKRNATRKESHRRKFSNKPWLTFLKKSNHMPLSPRAALIFCLNNWKLWKLWKLWFFFDFV